MSEKGTSLGYRKLTVVKITAAETPMLEMGRILKKKLSALRVKCMTTRHAHINTEQLDRRNY